MLQKLYGPLDVAYSDELDAKERAHSSDAARKKQSMPLAVWPRLPLTKLLPKRVPFYKRFGVWRLPSWLTDLKPRMPCLLTFYHNVFD